MGRYTFVRNYHLWRKTASALQVILLSLAAGTAYADDSGVISWNTELCSCQAKLATTTVDPGGVRKVLLYHFYDFEPAEGDIDLVDSDVEELARERDRYKQEADENIARLKAMSLPDLPAVQDFRVAMVRNLQLNAYLYLAKLEFMISGDTTELEKGFLGEELPSECKHWSQVLGSKQETRKAMPDFIEQVCANNGSPAECEMRIRTRTQTNSRAAQVELLMFGWHNCANNQYRQDLNNSEAAAVKAIESLLTEKHCECGEP